MSKLNLSSVRNTVPGENAVKQDFTEPKYESNVSLIKRFMIFMLIILHKTFLLKF